MKRFSKHLLLLPLIALSLSITSCGSQNTAIYVEDQIVNDYHCYSKKSSKYSYYELTKASGYTAIKSTGEVPILVIPVAIKGYEMYATEYYRNDIKASFFGETEETSWESVSSYYSKSSYGKCKITGEVTDWYDCGLTPMEIYMHQASRSSDDGGTWYILEKAIEWYKSTYDTDATEYDIDGDGFIDAVWLVYGCPDYSQSIMLPDTFWAFTYYDKNNKEKANVNNPVPYLYSWASFDFLYTTYGSQYIDSHTYIHETGHMFGLDDYYDYDGRKAPTGGVDMMDKNIIDHNSFTKFALGWLEPIVFTGSANVSLTPLVDSGECLLLTSSWNESAFDEYILVELYTPTGLNYQDSVLGYTSTRKGFNKVGVRIYHVDARLCAEGDDGQYYYTDKIDPNKKTVIASSNTGSYSMESSSICLINLIEADGKASCLQNDIVLTESCLFTSGKTFSISNYKNNFTNNRLNCGDKCNISVEIGTLKDKFVNIGVTM